MPRGIKTREIELVEEQVQSEHIKSITNEWTQTCEKSRKTLHQKQTEPSNH